MDAYQIAKDFAGPAATAFAAVTAGYFAWSLSRQQIRIAERQAETSLDQLRQTLFDRRYAIYRKVQNHIRLLISRKYTEDFQADEFVEFQAAIREARFFFPDSVCSRLQDLDKEASTFLQVRIEPGKPEFVKSAKALLQIGLELPEVFAPELEYRQLARRAPPAGGRGAWSKCTQAAARLFRACFARSRS